MRDQHNDDEDENDKGDPTARGWTGNITNDDPSGKETADAGATPAPKLARPCVATGLGTL